MKTIEDLYKENQKRYINMIKRYVKDQDLAEDIVQQAFLKSLICYHTFDDKKSSIKTWFSQVLFSELWSYLRNKNKQPPLLDIEEYLDHESLGRDDQDLLRKIVEAIDNKLHRQIIISKIVLGYTYKECSELYNMKQSTIRKVVQRFRKDAE